MIRTVLSDAQWDRIKDSVPGKDTDRGMTGRDNRLFVEAVPWVARTGAPWRDLPAGGRQLEQHLPALLALVEGRRLGESCQGLGR